jgi:hypothetical protein
MGIVMINCPKTGRAISTGLKIDASTFSCVPVFFSRTFCPRCLTQHEWFARDAWVFESNQKSLSVRASERDVNLSARADMAPNERVDS